MPPDETHRTSQGSDTAVVARVREGFPTGLLAGTVFGAISGAGYTLAVGGPTLAIAGWAAAGALVGLLATIIAAVAERRAHARPGERRVVAIGPARDGRRSRPR
jgi:hypothetical protein